MQLGSGTGTSFPTAVDTATTEVNAPAAGKTKARAEVINDILSALIAIETSIKDGTALPKYPSVKQVVTSSRAIGTVYQNSTGRPMFANVVASSTSNNDMAGISDSSATPATVVALVRGTANTQAMASFYVLPGDYYKVTIVLERQPLCIGQNGIKKGQLE